MAFALLQGQFLTLMGLIVLVYVVSAEGLKRVFYRRHGHRLRNQLSAPAKPANAQDV